MRDGKDWRTVQLRRKSREMYKPRLWMDNTQYSSARQLAGAVLKLRNIFVGKGQWPEIFSPAFFFKIFYLFIYLFIDPWTPAKLTKAQNNCGDGVGPRNILR